MRATLAVPVLAALFSVATAFSVPPTADDVISLLPGGKLTDYIWRSANPQSVLTPASDITLASIPQDEYYTITSALHPNHKVRIKSTDGWCDPHAKSYTGYIDTGDGKELFFYFFESRDKPKEDPVVMWINGGPGGSSAMGLFMELGPCTIKDSPKSANDTKPNPHSWNNHANIFFLDEPVGVGYSRAKHGQVVDTAEKAGKDVAAFVSIFFDAFKEFQGRAFHMSGESYGGRYLPVFASAVYDNNAALVKAGREPINLQSVLIGNGITDWYATTESYFPFMCNRHPDLGHSVLPIESCVALAEAIPKCHAMAKKGCQLSKDFTECALAVGYCSVTLASSFLLAGVNPYDVSKKCTPQEQQESLCYNETAKMDVYLNLPDVRSLFGIDKDAGKWSGISWDVNTAFRMQLDNQEPTWLYVAQLLERGVRVLNYVGTLDYICNYIGNEAWMEKLKWSGQEAYNAAEKRDWHYDGKVAGQTKSAGNLTFLTIYGAGHMVPMDRPKQSEAMYNAWLRGKDMPKLSYRRQLYDAGFSFSKDPDRSLIVYADGSCLDNGKHWAEAGIGLHWGEFDDAWDERTSEPLPGSNQTNNRAELYALIRAIETCPFPRLRLEIRSDSKYAIGCEYPSQWAVIMLTAGANEWLPKWRANGFINCKGNMVANADPIIRLSNLIQSRQARVYFIHVAGHDGDPGNEMADQLARDGAEAYRRNSSGYDTSDSDYY